MRSLLRRLFTEEKEPQVSKKNELKYTRIGDGLKPGAAPHGAVVRLPLELLVLPGNSAVLKLGISFNRACLVLPKGDLNARRLDGNVDVRVSGVSGDSLLPPDTEVVIWVNNRSDKEIRLDERTAVFDAIPVPDVEVSERG